MKIISILGSTGSIGRSALSVINLHPDKYKVFALSGFNNNDMLLEQALKFKPNYIVTKDLISKKILADKLKLLNSNIEVLFGEDGYKFIAAHEKVTTVIAAITGSAGLLSTITAAKSGKQILLANKESMVMAGDLLNKICTENSSTLIPVDSEHNAIWQCLPVAGQQQYHFDGKGVRRIILTASGGPFRDYQINDLDKVTPEQAVAHPNWSMGQKISVDSATMMNKGLEVIEAHWLFGLSNEQIDVVLHRQSIIHSMVDYVDGSVLAQMGNPDMRTPIANALAWPGRIDSGVKPLDLVEVGR